MAATVDTAAAKQAKQKKILIALSVVLVAVLAIQLPRMMGGSDAKPVAATTDGAATAETPAAAAAAPAATTAAAGATAAAAVTGTGPSTSVAGVTVAAAGTVEAGTSRLASFSLFETKDPFVQQVVEEKPDAGAPAAAGGDAAKGDAAATSANGSPGGSTAKPAAPVMTSATVTVNGEIEQLEVKDVFPEEEPLFKLLALKPKAAKIGIAGGSLADGQFVTLGLGKKITLVNSATGARYTIELQYVGTQPEQIEGFATGEDAAATSTTSTTSP
jgi:hypothetical protein